jgi:hypothetical protein
MESKKRKQPSQSKEVATPKVSAQATLEKVVDMVWEYGGCDGAHHKQWVLDQVLRLALGDKYIKFIKEKTGQTWDEETEEWTDSGYTWHKGIPP